MTLVLCIWAVLVVIVVCYYCGYLNDEVAKRIARLSKARAINAYMRKYGKTRLWAEGRVEYDPHVTKELESDILSVSQAIAEGERKATIAHWGLYPRDNSNTYNERIGAYTRLLGEEDAGYVERKYTQMVRDARYFEDIPDYLVMLMDEYKRIQDKNNDPHQEYEQVRGLSSRMDITRFR